MQTLDFYKVRQSYATYVLGLQSYGPSFEFQYRAKLMGLTNPYNREIFTKVFPNLLQQFRTPEDY